MEENEKLRFSQRSKEAFTFLKKVFKYNQEKREGSIVTKIAEGNEIIVEEKEVNKRLINHLKSVQKRPEVESYEDKPLVPFPVLEELSLKEMKEILSRVALHKALAGDLVSDILLDKDNIDRTCLLLKNLWSGIQIDCIHFINRLIALNKNILISLKKTSSDQ